MESVSLPIEAFSVSRDQVRVVRRAGRMTCGVVLLEALAHYTGVRTRMAHGFQKPLITERERIQNPVFSEIAEMPRLVEWNREQGIDNLRYLYGPKMASLAINHVQMALDERFLPQSEVGSAELLVNSYHDLG